MADFGTYWRMVAVCAVPRTLSAIGLPPAKIKQRAAMYAAAGTAAVALGFTQTVVEKGAWVLFVLAGAMLLFAVVLGYQLLTIPAELWKEQADELTSLKKNAMAREEEAKRLRALEPLCELGIEMQAAPIKGPEWCITVEAWDRDVQAALVQSFPNEAFGYRTITGRPPPGEFVFREGDVQKFLGARIAKLRKIIMRRSEELDEGAESGASVGGGAAVPGSERFH